MSRELLVRKIRNGTVIDHIPSGRGVKVLQILGLDLAKHETAVILVNMPSGKMGNKDVAKIENRELTPTDVNRIALLAPEATLNIVRDWEVVEKRKIALPTRLEAVARCPNPNCITNSGEPTTTRFDLEKRAAWRLRCFYCERPFAPEEISSPL